MKSVLKELCRHKWRKVFSNAGYTISALFIFIILNIHNTQKNNSFGILKSTGAHFIAYIPADENCCISNKADVAVFAEGVNAMMMDNSLLRTIKNVEGVKDAAPCLLFKMYHENFKSDILLAGIDTNSIATQSNVCARSSLIAGKFLSGNPDELIAGQTFTFAKNLNVGDTLHLFGGTMVLAGIVNSGIKPVKADFYAPIEFVRSFLKDKLQCSATGFDMNVILVEVADSRMQENVLEKIKNIMYKFNVSSYNCYEPAEKVMGIIDNASTVIIVLIIIFLVIFSAQTQTTALIERFRLQDKINLMPEELSAGQQKKVAIIRTLVKQPLVILADEPTGSVDQESEDVILNSLKDLRDNNNATVLFATHGTVTDQIADNVYVISEGRILT